MRLVKRLGGILFHLDLFDWDGDAWRVCRVDAIVCVEGDVAVSREGLCGGKDLACALGDLRDTSVDVDR